MKYGREDNYLCPSVRGLPPVAPQFTISQCMPNEGLETDGAKRGSQSRCGKSLTIAEHEMHAINIIDTHDTSVAIFLHPSLFELTLILFDGTQVT